MRFDTIAPLARLAGLLLLAAVSAFAVGVTARAAEPAAPVIDPPSPVLEHTAYFKASDTSAGDAFGHALAMSTDTLVVGAPQKGSTDPDDAPNSSGAAYVYANGYNGWAFEAKLDPPAPSAGALFGHSVAIDGDTIVVGAPSAGDDASGRAYVFVRSGSTWAHAATLQAPEPTSLDNFGWSVGISNGFIAVGAPKDDGANDTVRTSGRVFLFEGGGGFWGTPLPLTASNTESGDLFGSSLAMSGDLLVVGAVGEDGGVPGVDGDPTDNSLGLAGAAYVFRVASGAAIELAYLKASNPDFLDQFGETVAISGTTVVVGTRYEQSSATGVDGDELDDSLRQAGAAYVFEGEGGVWRQEAYLKASNTGLDDGFGISVAVSGDLVVVGAHREDSDEKHAYEAGSGDQGDSSQGSDSGAAYLFERSNGIWSHTFYIKASNTDIQDSFGGSHNGQAIAVAGSEIAVGAVGEASSATLLDGDQDDDSASDAGAVYLLLRDYR